MCLVVTYSDWSCYNSSLSWDVVRFLVTKGRRNQRSGRLELTWACKGVQSFAGPQKKNSKRMV